MDQNKKKVGHEYIPKSFTVLLIHFESEILLSKNNFKEFTWSIRRDMLTNTHTNTYTQE